MDRENKEHLKLSDLIPLVGSFEYNERNKDILKGLEFHPRGSLLAVYNVFLFTGVMNYSIKGLELLTR